MRIAFLTTTSLESPYSLGRCFPFARQLAALGHDVHIVALHHDLNSTVVRQFQMEQVWIHYVGQMHVRKAGNTTMYFGPFRLLWTILMGMWGLTLQAIRLHADVYQIGKPHPQNSFAGLVAARLFHRRLLLLDYDDLEVAINQTSNRWQQRVLAWLENTIPRWVDGVTVHSQFLKNRLLTIGVPEARLLHLPSCVDTTRFQPAAEANLAAWRERLALGNSRTLCYVGTLALASHPVDLLLYALATLVEQVDNLVLCLVGGGADLPALQKLASQLGIADACRFVGRVPPEEIPSLLRLAEISVDPVLDDLVAQARWPLKIVESIAAGVPVVTGDVGDRRIMLGDGKAGLLVEPGNAMALAQALAEILLNPALSAQLKAGCSAQAQCYDVVAWTACLLRFYQALPR